MKIGKSILSTLCLLIFCGMVSVFGKEKEQGFRQKDYPNIFDITCTPKDGKGGNGWFTDMGAWMGFTIPEKENFTNGFCGPIDLDHRQWVSDSLVKVGIKQGGRTVPFNEFTRESICYYPGYVTMTSKGNGVKITQELRFIDKNSVLLNCLSDKDVEWIFTGSVNPEKLKWETVGNTARYYLSRGECVVVTFPEEGEISKTDDSYTFTGTEKSRNMDAVISFYNNKEDMESGLVKAAELRKNNTKELLAHTNRWEKYISQILRTDRKMPKGYDRAAVKAMTTLISNWRTAKGDLLRDGMTPSHVFPHFSGGFWAWDTWQQAVATVRFDPELAKSQMKAMFDYQDEAGMVADCIKSNKKYNNYRDTKPPLSGWAVWEIYEKTGDKEFVKEMYPKVLKYHEWWYKYRDNDKNGICEFGSTDGSKVAALWESGMDNAVRYDEVNMLKNSEAAWSLDQESVDLNYYLALEYRFLVKMAELLGEKFILTDKLPIIKGYFFDKEKGYFYDRKLGGELVRVEGPEGWTPVWTGLASREEALAVRKITKDPKKFSTYIPFPTLAADNPKFSRDGYWRGPIWMNQTYFGISGCRKYGMIGEADTYTDQVFTRLQGLLESGAIHENYDTHTGEALRAAHFSWASAFILMLYWEYGKEEPQVVSR